MRIIFVPYRCRSQRRLLRGLTITFTSLIGYSAMGRDCRRRRVGDRDLLWLLPLRNRSDGCYRSGADCAGSGRSDAGRLLAKRADKRDKTIKPAQCVASAGNKNKLLRFLASWQQTHGPPRKRYSRLFSPVDSDTLPGHSLRSGTSHAIWPSVLLLDNRLPAPHPARPVRQSVANPCDGGE